MSAQPALRPLSTIFSVPASTCSHFLTPSLIITFSFTCLLPASARWVWKWRSLPRNRQEAQREPAYSSLPAQAPHFWSTLLGPLPVTETPPRVPGPAWPDGWSFQADEGLGWGQRVGSSHPCRFWAGTLGTVGGGPGHVVKTGWDQEGRGKGTVRGGWPHLRFWVVSRLPLTEAGNQSDAPEHRLDLVLLGFSQRAGNFPNVRPCSLFISHPPPLEFDQCSLSTCQSVGQACWRAGRVPGAPEHPEWLTKPVWAPLVPVIKLSLLGTQCWVKHMAIFRAAGQTSLSTSSSPSGMYVDQNPSLRMFR